MDKQIFALLIPVLALTIPVVAIVFGGMQKVARLRLEEARVRASGQRELLDEDVAQLHDEVIALRAEVANLHERLVVAERLLPASASTRERTASAE